MDTDLLRTFIEVNKTRHFGKAATNLYLTQSAVSFRIRQLEIQLGTPVFTRKRGDLRLTTAGERFMPYAKSILQTWGKARQDVALTGDYQQMFSMGASNLIWEALWDKSIVEQMQSRHPNWAMATEVLCRQQVTHGLMERQVDFVLTTEIPKLANLRQEKVFEFNLVLVASNPVSQIEQIAILPLVSLDWGEQLNVEQTQLTQLQRPPLFQSHSIRSAHQFLLNKGGIGYMPEHMITKQIESGALHLVDQTPIIHINVFAVWMSTSDKDEQISRLISSVLPF